MTRPPPVPPKNQSPQGTGDPKNGLGNAGPAGGRPDNLEEQDRQGNIKQNTTNQGYQQDR